MKYWETRDEPLNGMMYKGDVSQFFIRGTSELVEWCEDELGRRVNHVNSEYFVQEFLMGRWY